MNNFINKKQLTIYLAGKIQKAHENPNETYWTEDDQLILCKHLAPSEIHFLNPAIRSDDLSNQQSVFGRDMLQVFSAEVIFVDARDRRGLGVGAEMMWAKMNHKPVITLAPIESHYHKTHTSLLGVEVSSWIHPFVESLSDVVVESLEQGADWLKQKALIEVKGPEWIQKAMHYYVSKQFTKDAPMLSLSKKSNPLSKAIQQLCSEHQNLVNH